MNVLIVDDNAEKAAAVLKVLEDSGVCNASGVEDVRDATAARRRIRERYFDLVILDVTLPQRVDEPATPKAGIDLLREITTRVGYKIPGHILGLTAFEDALALATEQFEKLSWSVLTFSRDSTLWAERLTRKVHHIAASKAAAAAQIGFDFDFAVVTALREPEFDAFAALPWEWSEYSWPEDAGQYLVGQFERSGTRRRVIMSHAPSMGMVASAALTTKMLLKFRPRVLVMGGILAGRRGETEFGDVVVGSPVWDWGSGKYDKSSDEANFQVAPYQCNISPALRGLIDRLAADSSFLSNVRDRWPGLKPPSALQVRIGPVATGASLVANAGIMDLVKEQHRKLIGLDMEAYGVMSAGEQGPHPQSDIFIAKSVSDYADEKKDDRFRHYAAYSSANVTAEILGRIADHPGYF